MSKIKDDNYYQISGWMLNRLNLKGVELQVFAIIYGFSQDGESVFSGSLSYLCDWVGASKPTVIKALKDLVIKNYVIKETHEVNHVTFNRYRANMSTIEDFKGSKESLQGSEEPLLNNNSNNNTNTLSKDNVSDSRSASNPAQPATPISGKLFSSQRNTAKNSPVERANRFITACQREAIKKEFPEAVLKELDKYFRMLAELNCLLPSVSIAEQLVHLSKVPADRQVAVVKNTVSRGWKSLQYEAEAITTGGAPRGGSFVDTASPNTFKATPEEEKNGDWKQDIPADHIF